MAKEIYRYRVRFYVKGKHETVEEQEEVLPENHVEFFVWGAIRKALREKRLPLTGYATNIEVYDEATGKCIGKYDSLYLPSTPEMENIRRVYLIMQDGDSDVP